MFKRTAQWLKRGIVMAVVALPFRAEAQDLGVLQELTLNIHVEDPKVRLLSSIPVCFFIIKHLEGVKEFLLKNGWNDDYSSPFIPFFAKDTTAISLSQGFSGIECTVIDTNLKIDVANELVRKVLNDSHASNTAGNWNMETIDGGCRLYQNDDKLWEIYTSNRDESCGASGEPGLNITFEFFPP